MASEVDVCNLALARLGDEANVVSIDPPEACVQAEHCARFYPMARDSLQQMHAWGFTTRRESLPLLAQVYEPWLYAYRAPANALNLLAVQASESLDDAAPQPFVQEWSAAGDVILTNQANAVLRYTARVADTALFPPLFVDALAWLLAGHLAGPLLKGDSGVQAAQRCQGAFEKTVSRAIESDANQRRFNPYQAAPWIAGR